MKEIYIKLIILFILVQALGLVIANQLIQEKVQVKIINEDSEDLNNVIFLITYVLVFTGIILLLIKFHKGLGLLRVFEAIAIFFATIIAISLFFGDLIAIISGIIIVSIKNLKKQNIIIKNITAGLSVAVIGAIIGLALGTIPVIILLALFAIYDLIAVFKTKHMTVLAKNIVKKNLAFTFALPTKTRTFELGTGDLVMPLVFASSILKYYSPVFLINLLASIAILFASVIGLLWTIKYSIKNPKKALPALPLQVLTMFLMIAILKVSGF